MNFVRHRNEQLRHNSNQILLPKISINQAHLPINLQRASSLNNFILPKLSARGEAPSLSSAISSPLLQKNLSSSISHSPYKSPLVPGLSASVRSSKNHGIVNLYCANTHRGIVRGYNEDRVMIMLKIPKSNERKDEKWPPCSFFGLYDGHGGKNCSNFLRDNLHLFITQDSNFPSDPQQAIIKGFERAESTFLEMALKKKDKSGSCAVIVLIVGKKCYVANLGDSRAVMSCNNGAECIALTKDHKPNEENENKRIIQAGGEVYASGQSIEQSVSRILPGRLAISRAFGDVEAKIKDLGGNPYVLIAVPEIRVFCINKLTDFIILGSDGIFDRLNNKEVVDIIINQDLSSNDDPLTKLTRGVESILVEAMRRESLDNVTILAVAFENFTKNKNE